MTIMAVMGIMPVMHVMAILALMATKAVIPISIVMATTSISFSVKLHCTQFLGEFTKECIII